MRFQCYLFLSHLFLLDLLYFLSSDESDLLNDDSDYVGSYYGSSSTYSFHSFSLSFDNYVGCVSGLGSGVFLPT